MKKERILFTISLMLAVTFCAMGCGTKSKDDISIPAVEGSQNTAVDSEDNSAETEENMGDYSLEDIAELNGLSVEDLNVGYDKEGHINFIGHKYSDVLINDENDALESLKCINSLLELDDITLVHSRTDVSPTSNTTYYSFVQCEDVEQNGDKKVGFFGNSSLKVIVDKDGYSTGVSSTLKYGEIEKIDTERMVTKEEAEEYVRNLIGEQALVYSDNTQMTYWDDQLAASTVGIDSKLFPVWAVYADAPNISKIFSDEDLTANNGSNLRESQYIIYIVSAVRGSEESDTSIIGSFCTDSLGDVKEIEEDDYLSKAFFSTKESAGEYTYDVDLTWVKEAYPDYNLEMTRSITVPVMYDKETELYYLGDYDEMLTVANCYDMRYLYEGATANVNPLVTDNPEDINSWHFETMNLAGTDRQYFCNPNYVISSFDAYRTVYLDFKDRYGINSYDYSGLPLILLVYTPSDSYYPEDVLDFDLNASNGSQKFDWGMFFTSPAFPECLAMPTMFHEFTHGINGCLTTTQMLNEPGAVAESYADIIAIQMAKLYEPDKMTNDWMLGGDYWSGLRDFSNPHEFSQPVVFEDKFYVASVDGIAGSLNDNGGVHVNSGILNYFAYCLLEPSDIMDGEEALTLDKSLDTWFELLYMSNNQTDISDVAHYIMLSARLNNCSEGNTKLLERLIENHGLISGKGDESLKDSDSKPYCINISFEDEAMSDTIAIAGLITDMDIQARTGGNEEHKDKLTVNVLFEEPYYCFFEVGDKVEGLSLGICRTMTSYTDENINLTVKPYVDINAGETFKLPENEVACGGSLLIPGLIAEFVENETFYVFEDEGYYLMLSSSINDNNSMNLYIVKVK